MPALPRVTPQLPNTAQTIPEPEMPLRLNGPAAAGATPGTSAKPPETPIVLQRHPARNLSRDGGGPAFTFRTTGAAKVLAQLSLGIQNDTWHTDNLTNAKRSLAVEDVIMEWRPIVQLSIGSLSADDSLRSDYHLELRYTPTQHTLLNAGTSRMLQRMSGELGRTTPILTSAVRFEYDENIFGARGNNSVEESSTVTEITPVIEYSLSAKTVLHAWAAWRRFVSQNASTNRSEYIFQTGFANEISPKTTLGMDLEFGHIPFDQAQYGAQNYQQICASMIWLASPKIHFQTRAGVELRQFDKPVPKPALVTPVASMTVNWSPSDRAQLNTGFLVRNQPSVSQRGATFQEIRFGMDARQQMGRHYYIKGEAAVIRRNYDSGTRELEIDVRPALGYRSDVSRRFDILNIEIYYQFRRVDSNQRGADRDRNLFGIESTLLF